MMLLPLSESDMEPMLEMLTDRRIAETYMLPEYTCAEEAIPLFRRMLLLSRDENRYVRGIFADTRLVGFLNDVEIRNGSIELGYVIHPDQWNRGYATQALKLAIRQLFDAGYREILAGAFSWNTPSIRVMEKSGMVKTDKTETVTYRASAHSCVYYRAVP